MFLFFVILPISTLLFLRLLWILPSRHPSATPSPRSPHPNRNDPPKHLMILFRSGGNTAEVLLLLSSDDVEGFARVSSLSLSGKLLYPIVDRFLVQWPRLSERYPRAEYRDVLVFS